MAMGANATPARGDEASVIRSEEKNGVNIIAVAGSDPHGTNYAIATLMQMIKAEGKSAYLNGPLDLHNQPSYAIRGIHLNGWPLNYPYAFRAWKEADWKRFVDIAWTQHINCSTCGRSWKFAGAVVGRRPSYLQEVRRVVDWAENQRGMEVWIMQSANRIGTSATAAPGIPRIRPYWVNDCQKDMNPAEPSSLPGF